MLDTSRVRMSRQITKGLAIAALAAGACGAPRAPEPTGRLMDHTTAGSNRCTVTKSHTRPFVIEWDATDLASFQAKAEHDLVFVRYQGCNLTVLDCADGSVRGKLGAYRPTEWTSGGLESFEMTTEQDLYAQLPLGAPGLAGRVNAGESLRLRYFVSGVVTATRDTAYRTDLPAQGLCAGATHFVYAYNLGAFELASGAHTRTSSGPPPSERAVLKRGGELDACRDEISRANKRCAVPIRITLREIEAGPTPYATSPHPPPSGGMDAMLEAGKLRTSAQRKLQDGDGAGCLRDLERALEVDPDRERADVQCQLHGQCTMRAGKCDLGKELLRACYGRLWGKNGTPEAMTSMIDAQAKLYCPR
ncbi:MAG: hypothetical protein JST00_15605 [Deltaproteobacteria bacterium]|nr:hypothetical protein [Deltaproteobacteria bacterium]